MELFRQGPSSSRSVTATSVHPLALEHTAILRAHFGITGRILRTTVLRDQKTGTTPLGSGAAHLVGFSTIADLASFNTLPIDSGHAW